MEKSAYEFSEVGHKVTLFKIIVIESRFKILSMKRMVLSNVVKESNSVSILYEFAVDAFLGYHFHLK